MKIYGNRYIYGLIDHVVYRYDVFSINQVNTWEQLPNNGDFKMQYIVLDNTKNYLYGIPHGTDQSKVFRYDILNKIWKPYTYNDVPDLGGAILLKILFTVDNNEKIYLDSNGCIWYQNKKIFNNTNNTNNTIFDIILNNTGTHLFMLMNLYTSTTTSIVKILLQKTNMENLFNETNQYNLFSFTNIDNINNNYDSTTSQLTAINPIPNNQYSPLYNGWTCSNNNVKSCGTKASWSSMGLGDVYGFQNAVKACNKLEECSGFYKYNEDYFLTTNAGLPPVINPSQDAKDNMSAVYIKKNTQNYSSHSMLLSYDGSKIYYITPKNELKYFNIRTCKSSQSLLPNIPVSYITLGPDRELYATHNTLLYKITTTNNNVIESTYSATIVRKFGSLNPNNIITLCHNRPSIFIKYKATYYYVDKYSKSLTKADTSTLNYTIYKSTDQITKEIDISNKNCLYYATSINNNYMNINKGTYTTNDLEIPDCNNYQDCNCYYSQDTLYYNKISGQPAVFSRSNNVNGLKFINNPYLKGYEGDKFTYCIPSIGDRECKGSCKEVNDICMVPIG